MRSTTRPTLGAVILAACALAGAAEPDMLLVLEQRANRPVVPLRSGEAIEQHPAGRLLFSMPAPHDSYLNDNARCVLGVDDVTGDGTPEVVVGFEYFGAPNVLCLDGTSRGSSTTVVWSHQTSAGYIPGDQAIVPASDVDGNGYPNLLVGTGGGGRTAHSLDSFDGTVLWRFSTWEVPPGAGFVYSLAELDDVNGDLVPDVAFGAGSENDSVYVVDGASSGGAGSQAAALWSFFAGDSVYSVRDIGDADGDGRHDVLVAAGDNADTLTCLSGSGSPPSGDVLWSYDPSANLWACGVLPDVTGDGVNEALAVVWTTDGSAVRCRDGATGGPVWSSTAVPMNGMMVDILEDVTGDGTPEVVVSSWENAVIVLSGVDGSLVWKTTVPDLYGNGGDVWSARAIDDLDGDGVQDVIAGSFNNHVYAVNGVDGAVLWAFNTPGNRVYTVMPVGDLNHDGRPEVAVGTQEWVDLSDVVFVLWGEPPLFADDLESGTTGAWTFTQP